jgi:hypothetical protein
MTASSSTSNLASVLPIVIFYALVIPTGAVVGRDAQRHGRNGLQWGLLFVFNPLVFGVAYLVVRKRVPGSPYSPDLPAGNTEPWPISSSASLQVDKFLVVLSGLAALTAFILVGADLTMQRPVNGLALLLVPGIPILVVGQVWVIVVQNARSPKATGPWRERMRTSVSTPGEQWGRLFGGLPKTLRAGVVAGFFIGWLAAMTAFPSLSDGGPAPATPTCPWPLSNHGVITNCVSHIAYLQAGATVQRLAAGVLAGFFVFHFGAALSEVLRRSRGRAIAR